MSVLFWYSRLLIIKTTPTDDSLSEEINTHGPRAVLGMLWVPLIVGGSYLLVHANLKILSKERK